MYLANVYKRDLKPSNIGFDAQGKVKIFDFGLAREYTVNAEGKNMVKPRRMTGGTGSLRYMAPEVARMEEYGSSADVHSFAILLWQIVTNRVPFAKIPSRKTFESKVINGNLRPNLKAIHSDSLKGILSAGWSLNPDQRPTFAWITRELQKIVRPSCTRAISLSSFASSLQRSNKVRRDSVAKGIVRQLMLFARRGQSNSQTTFLESQRPSFSITRVNHSKDVSLAEQSSIPFVDTTSISSTSRRNDNILNKTIVVVKRGQTLIAEAELASPAQPRRR